MSRFRPAHSRGRSRRGLGFIAIVATVACGVALTGAAPAGAAAALAARASVQSDPQYINDSAGATLTFTIQNTGATDSIGAVEIDSPGAQEVIDACPVAPAGWTTQASATTCLYLSASTTADDLTPGATSSLFQVHATNVDTVTDYIGTWSVTVSKSNNFNLGSGKATAFATGAGLRPTAYTWEVTDAVVAAAAPAPGTPCPASNKSAPAGSTGNVIVLCGQNHSTRQATPSASLGGTFIDSAGAFTTGRIAASSGNVVIGSWSAVTVSPVAGSSETVVAQLTGPFTHQTSPSTTLTGYQSIGAVNHPPVTSDDAYTTDEDTTLTVAAPGVLGNDSDPDGDVIHAVSSSGPSHGQLTLNPDGSFSYVPDANFSGSDSFTYRANDGTTSGNVAVVTITVTSVNDAPSFDLSPTVQSVSSDSGPQTVTDFAFNISAGPPNEAGQVLTFHVSNDNNGLFSAQPSIDVSTGTLTYTPASGQTGSAIVSVFLTDDGGTANGGTDTSATQTFQITVTTAVNHAPSFSLPSSPNQSIFEDSGAQSVLGFAGAISAGPPDEAGQTLTFHVSADNNALFSVQPSINLSSGDLTYTPAPNANGSATVSVYLTDNGGTANGGSDTSATQTFTITVNAVNDAPSFTLPAQPDQSVSEGAGPQTVLGFATNIVAGPPDESGQQLTFNVTNDLNSLFATQPSIDPATGTLSYTPAPNQAGLATITVSLSDDGGVANGGQDTSGIQTFAITVVVFNHAPSFSLPASPNQSVLEDAGAQTVVGFATGISAGPGEAGQVLTFHVSADNPSLFSSQPSIDPTTGTLTYTPASNANGSATVSVFLTDNGGTANGGHDTSATQTFTITVTAVNDAPSFSLPASPNQSVLQDSGAQTVPGFATAIVAGPPDESAQVLTFHVTNDNNALFSAQPSIAVATGNLTYTPASGQSGSATVSVSLSDDGGTANGGHDTSATKTFTISVGAVNHAPSFALPASPNQSVLEDAGAQSVAGFMTGISAGPPAESGQTLTSNVSNDNVILFSTQPSIDIATGNLTYTPAANANGSATVSVFLTDNGGVANGGHDTSATQTFTITVTAVNDAPSFSLPASPNQSVLQDSGAQTVAGFATSIVAGPPDESGQVLTFHVSNDNNALFSAQPSIAVATGNLTYTPASGQTGSATVSVFLSDDGGTANGGHDTSLTKTFTISVGAVNHAPTFTLPASPNQSVLEDAGAQTVVGFATGISAGPANESGQTLTFHVSNDNNGLFSAQPSIAPATGNLTYTPAPNANGSATVSVFLTDNGGTANGGHDTSATQTFTISVTAVNDGPSFSLPASPNQSVLNNAGAQTVTGFATSIIAGPANESGQVLTFHVTNDNNALFSAQPSINVATGNLTYTPASAQSGSATVSVSLSDDGGTANGGHDTSPTKTFTITVTSSNSAPTDIALSASSIAENSGVNAPIGTFTSTDPDVGDTHTYTLASGTGSTDNASFNITAAGVLQENASFNFETKSSFSIRVRSTDGGGLFFEKAFTITVTNVNEAPTDIALSASTIAENSGANAPIGTFTSTDPDAGGTHAYTLVTGTGSTDNASFNITAAGGLQENASLNFEVKSSYSIRVRSTDNGGLFFEKAFTITVTNVNEAPTDIAISASSIPENSGANAPIGTFTSTDPDAGGTHAYTLVTGTGSTDNASFNIAAAGGLQENASFNFETKSSYSIRVRSTDNGGLFFEKAFTITVTNVNEAPTDIALSASSIAENHGVNAAIGTFTSTDPDAGGTHAYTLVTGTGSTDNASFNITAAGVLQENASFNFEVKSSYSIRVRTTDNGGLFFEKAFTITITDVDDAPVAFNDTYTGAFGNTQAVLGTTGTGPTVTLTGNKLIANDTDEDTGAFAHALAAVAETVTTATGGSATINADGSFTYISGVGARNQDDTFTYHVTDGTLATAGTVTIHVNNAVWYVNSASSASTHDGRSNSPFLNLSSLNAANGTGDLDASGDVIFLYRGNSGTTPYAGGIPLEANESLAGESAGLTIGTINLVSPGPNPAVLTNSAGVGLGLASGTEVEGVTITGTSGDGIAGVGVSVVGVGLSAPVTVTNSGGDGIHLSGAAGGSTTINANVSGSAQHSVDISGRTSGTVQLGGTISDTGTGISLTGNTGATINLSGAITASTGANNAFVATGGGTVSATSAANTLTTTTGTALDVENTTISASTLSFRSITANGGSHGIVLINTGTVGVLNVVGTGTAASGGTITGITGADLVTNACASLGSTAPVGVGIYLNNTLSPSFAWMNFPGTFGNFGILGYNVNGFGLVHSTMTGTYGNNVDQDEDTVHFCTLTGNVGISNDTISNGAETNLRIVNASGTLNRLTMANDTIGFNQTLGGDGTLLEADGGTLNATVTDTTFLGSRGSPFQAVPQAGATMDLVFGAPGHGNTIHNTDPNFVSSAQDLNVAAGGNLTFDINSNHFDSASTTSSLGGVFINAGLGTAVASGYFRNNTIGTSGVANSGSSGGDPALDVESNGGGDLTISITNNQIFQFGGSGAGFLAQAGQTFGNPTTFNVTATGNTITQPGTFAVANGSQGFQLDNGTNSGENFTSCLNFASNTVNGSGTGAGGDVRLRQRFDTKVQLPGYTGAVDGTGVVAYIQSKDPAGPPSVTDISSTAAGGGFFNTPGGAACAVPSF